MNRLGHVAGAVVASVAAYCAPAWSQAYSVPAPLQARIDSHPHTRQLTDWGGRPDWSADSKRLLFMSREYGDAFELDVATGKSRPLTFHFSHDGILRAYYAANGDILLTAPRDHTPGRDQYGRFFESEIWLLKADLSGPAVPLGEFNREGIAVARGSMRIAWGRPVGAPPPKGSNTPITHDTLASFANEIWIGDIEQSGGTARLANKRRILDCAGATGELAEIAARKGGRCILIEPQNFVPSGEDRLTFTMVMNVPHGAQQTTVDPYVVDLKTGKVTELASGPGYAEPEGIFPDGKWTLVEYSAKTDIPSATHTLDLWRVPLDGSGTLERVTRYNSLDPELKSNQGVVSPDGRWLAFDVSTREIEKRVAGQGLGVFLMDLRAAGIR